MATATAPPPSTSAPTSSRSPIAMATECRMPWTALPASRRCLHRGDAGSAVQGIRHSVAIAIGDRELVGAEVDGGGAVAVAILHARLAVEVEGGEGHPGRRGVGAGV